MEALIIVLIPAFTALAVSAAVESWLDRRRQEGQALALSYIQHLQAARRIAIKNAESTEQKWLTSAELFRDASNLQSLIESAQRDYPHDIFDIGRARHGNNRQGC